MNDATVPYRLTKERRFAVCVHEAAHAVVGALYPFLIVHAVAVAPEGASEWRYETRKGRVLVDLWGVCETSDDWQLMLYARPAPTERDAWPPPDRAGYRAYLRQLRAQSVELERYALQSARANVRCYLAGPIADLIFSEGWSMSSFASSDYYVDEDGEGDGGYASAICYLLPYRNEHEHACRETAEILTEPEVWACVMRLAEALAIAGRIDDGIDEFLPLRKYDWPRSPRFKGSSPTISAEELRRKMLRRRRATP